MHAIQTNNERRGKLQQQQQTPIGNNGYEVRPFSVLPFMIKTEPTDIEVMSDITIDTNTEGDDGGASSGYNTNSIQHNGASTPYQYTTDTTTTLQQQTFIHGTTTTTSNGYSRNCIPNMPYVVAFNNDGVINSAPQQVQQMMTQSMVQLNDNNLLKSATHSDIEFVNNYLPVTSSVANDVLAYSVHSPSLPPILSSTDGGLIVANAKVTKTISVSSKTTSSPPSDTQLPTLQKSLSQQTSTIVPPISRNEEIKKKLLNNRELQSIQQIDLKLNTKRVKKSIGNSSYGLRQKQKGSNKPNYSLTSNSKKVINPANRLRQRIKTEMLSKSLPVMPPTASNTTVNKRKEDLMDIEDNKSTIELKRAIEKNSKSINSGKSFGAIEKKKTSDKSKIEKKDEKTTSKSKNEIIISNTDRFSFPSISTKKSTTTEITTAQSKRKIDSTNSNKFYGAKLKFKIFKRS